MKKTSQISTWWMAQVHSRQAFLEFLLGAVVPVPVGPTVTVVDAVVAVLVPAVVVAALGRATSSRSKRGMQRSRLKWAAFLPGMIAGVESGSTGQGVALSGDAGSFR